MRHLPLFLLLLAPLAAHAQIGIGGQIGEPTGLALKVGTGSAAFDLAAEWDLEDAVFLQAHLLLAERRFPGTRTDIRYFYGPGGFIRASENADTAAGLSLNAGLAYYTGPVEIFAQLTPRLRLTPNSDFDIGGALGLRFYP